MTEPKKRRIQLACENCRNRKVGCDGAQPSCQRCIKRSESCFYVQRSKKASEAYVKELERRLRIIENGNNEGSISNNSSKTIPAITASYMKPISSIIETTFDVEKSPEKGRSFLWNILNESGGSVNPETDITDYHYFNDTKDKNKYNGNSKSPEQIKEEQINHIDAMGAGVPITKENGEQEMKEFYGSSAALSFMKMLSQSVDRQVSRPTNTSSKMRREVRYHMSRNSFGNCGRSQLNWVFPSRSVANEYVKRYFRYVYPLYPFVHKTTFMVAYEAIWTGDATMPESDNLFYCILNLVFALGCHHNIEAYFDSNSNTQLKDANKDAAFAYFTRAQNQLFIEIMGSSSLLLVQTLLLSAQYLQATHQAEACWNTVGLAIRVAQSSGLHLSHHIKSRGSLIEQQMCKRIWHGCLMMDRIVSMTFGRPLMITSVPNIEFPQAVNDELITDDEIRTNTEDKKTELRFFQESIKLFNVLWGILRELYLMQDENTSNIEDPFSRIFKFERQLQEFHNDLPDYLNYDTFIELHPYKRQAVVLRARYLHLKIMLYRPVLLSNSRNWEEPFSESESSLYIASKQTICKACVESALDLILLLHSYMPNHPYLLPASWYNVFYIYTSAIVLLAAMIQPELGNCFEPKVLENAWENCLELLKNAKSRSNSASCTLRILEDIHQRISSSQYSFSVNTDSSEVPPIYDSSDFTQKDLNNNFDFIKDSDFLFSTIYPDFIHNGKLTPNDTFEI